MKRHQLLRATIGLIFFQSAVSFAQVPAPVFPQRPIELVVPASAGGGTDILSRAFSDAARPFLSQPVVVVNKPGASGGIGHSEVANAKPDGYKLAMVTVELVTLPHLGTAKFTMDDFVPIVRLNADPSAVTVRADAPWNTIEEFLDAARKKKGEISVGNAGTGSIWHLAAVALEEKTKTQFIHVPFQGGAPAVLALVGGQLDAVTVSPAEVSAFVASGRLKTLAVMADKRVKSFERVPTLKERNIDLSIGTWRGLAAPKGTPPEVISALVAAATSTGQGAQLRESMDKANLGYSFADSAAFRSDMVRENAFFKELITKLNIKN